MDIITRNILKTKEYGIFKESILDDLKTIYVTGLDLFGASFFVRTFLSGEKKPSLIIVPSDLDAKKFYEEMSFTWDNLYYLPPREIVYFDSFAHSNELLNQRMVIIDKILNMEKIVVIASIEAVLTRQLDEKSFRSFLIKVSVGDTYNLDDFLVKLLSAGYERVDKVEFKGSFCLKGGILDIFDPQYEEPLRIEFFDNEIDSIRKFQVDSQVSIEKIDKIEILPAREILLSADKKEEFLRIINEQIKNPNILPELKNKGEIIIEQVNKIGYFDKLDLFVEYFCEKNICFSNYFSKESKVFFVNPEKIRDNAMSLLKSNLIKFEDYFSRGRLFPNQYNLLIRYEDFLNSLSLNVKIIVDNLQKKLNDFAPDQIVGFKALEAPFYHGKIFDFVEDVKRWSYKGYKILVFLDDKAKEESIKNQLVEENVPINNINDIEKDKMLSSQCSFLKGHLTKGIIFDSIKFVIITENELFNLSKGQKIKKDKNKKMIKSFVELKKGDFVVHESHGIGKYIGIEQLKVENMIKDYFKIMYYGEDFLYIPIDQMEYIQKYIGGEEKKIKLHKMSGSEWKKTKIKAKKAIEDMTDELLELYAERKSKKGYIFSKDTEWQKNLENMFPYEETPDQLKCIEEIKRDMENETPMDRLLCGDVGFGKTEVAVRAAFKAINDSKQVAILVPTTILAQQHYNTIKERFSKFPVNVEVLSRFKTRKEQEKIIEDIRTDNVDVIIGTHRLLSKDVKFNDLGLLIVDEEQRFGVKHKEKIKKMKSNVDILTLTATPIPRTLHMSLIGIRDMSIIEDPPEDRYPIQTYVVEDDELLIKEAIEKEISRGGQIYYVYNNVKNIDFITSKLKKLVPDARINYAHGQMNEGKLEKIMYEFLAHEFDVLVCTTIIETGLDISNVNTIIIESSDRMGISQLYQLRGRVGRSNRIAYAYLLYKKDKVLSEIAEKRLKGIKEFTELGSGFKIAMRDLEIRGSGNILGSEQHGHIDAIGYEYYCKLLEDAVNKVKGKIVEEKIETEIEFVINAFIPENYIKNGEDKIEIYKKISSIRDRKDAYSIEEEVEDRYGTLPISIYNLIGISYVKSLAQKLGIKLIKENKKDIILKFSNVEKLSKEVIEKIMLYGGNNVSFNLSNEPVVEYKFYLNDVSKEEKLKVMKTFLEKIVV